MASRANGETDAERAPGRPRRPGWPGRRAPVTSCRSPISPPSWSTACGLDVGRRRGPPERPDGRPGRSRAGSPGHDAKDAVVRFWSTLHAATYRVTDGRALNRVLGMRVVQLTTTGRRSGTRRPTMLTAPIVGAGADRPGGIERGRRPGSRLVPQRARLSRRVGHRGRRHIADEGPGGHRLRSLRALAPDPRPRSRPTPTTRVGPAASYRWSSSNRPATGTDRPRRSYQPRVDGCRFSFVSPWRQTAASRLLHTGGVGRRNPARDHGRRPALGCLRPWSIRHRQRVAPACAGRPTVTPGFVAPPIG